MSQLNIFAIRLDGNDPNKLIDVLKADGGAYLVVKEMEGVNPHYHGVIHTTKKLPAFRAALKRAMPELNGNKSYSVSGVRELEKYQRYMLKGEARATAPDIVGGYGITYQDQEWLDERHDAFWDEADEITRRRKARPVAEDVLAACRTARINYKDREKIAEMYIRELVDRNKAINLYSVKSSVSLIQAKLCPDDSFIKDLVNYVINY